MPFVKDIIYQTMKAYLIMLLVFADGIRHCDKKVQIALCKEMPQVWKAVGLEGKGLFCNCTG
jgi:hypothetical protein